MNYLDSINTFRVLEEKYDVMSIKYKRVALWPCLRIYLFDALTAHRATGYSSSALKVLLSSLFCFNPLLFFKRYDVWNYSSSTTRKKVGDSYEHHVSGYLHKSNYKVLTIEGQSPGIKKIRRAEIPEKNIISASWAYAFTAFFELCMRWRKFSISGEDVLVRIINELDISFDYKKQIRWLIAQKTTTDFFLSIGVKPRLMIVECSYTQMGRIWAAHNHGIPVVELQHGVLNAKHYAYNPSYHSPLLYPDEICVYGEEEYSYFKNVEKCFADNVSMTGLYILDKSSEFFKEDLFKELHGQNKRVIVVAGQVGGEEKLSSFIDSIAEKLPSSFFVYIPRHVIELSFKSSNVVLKTGVNIYEYLKWCDVHVTISSTTCLEAHYYKKPVIFCDFNGVAEEYYGRIIGENNGAFYVHTEEEFLDRFNSINSLFYEYRELFAHNSERRMQEMLDRYLNKCPN